VAVEIHELDADLLERALRQQVTLDARERLVRVVVRLLDQTQLLSAWHTQEKPDQDPCG
jgi:hypothetical protein